MDNTSVPSRGYCKLLWEGNRDYVRSMGGRLNIGEASLLARKQNALYLAWHDGDYRELMGQSN